MTTSHNITIPFTSVHKEHWTTAREHKQTHVFGYSCKTCLKNYCTYIFFVGCNFQKRWGKNCESGKNLEVSQCYRFDISSTPCVHKSLSQQVHHKFHINKIPPLFIHYSLKLKNFLLAKAMEEIQEKKIHNQITTNSSFPKPM